jgi:hypothetical protein
VSWLEKLEEVGLEKRQAIEAYRRSIRKNHNEND